MPAARGPALPHPSWCVLAPECTAAGGGEHRGGPVSVRCGDHVLTAYLVQPAGGVTVVGVVGAWRSVSGPSVFLPAAEVGGWLVKVEALVSDALAMPPGELPVGPEPEAVG